MTNIWKLIGFGKGLFYVIKSEREVKDEIEKKGLERFLEDHNLYSSQNKETVAK